MTKYFLRECDRAGHVLSDECVHAGDVHAALALANRRFGAIVREADQGTIGALSRIDVADDDGHTVARLICSEAMAGL